MDRQIKLLALAHLKNGLTPTEVSNIESLDLTYARALKLKKQLYEAEQTDTILKLFELQETALEMLLESVKKDLTPAIEAFGIGELVEDEVHELSKSVAGGKLLNQDLQQAASALAQKITQVAIVANNAETVLSLAKSLSELQTAFFGPGAHGAGAASGAPGLPAPGAFERHLRS